MSDMNMWRICSAGSTWWLAHDSLSFGGKYFCPAHLTALFDGFDPRPYGQGGSTQTVKFIDGSIGGGAIHDGRHEPEWVVIARNGDALTLRRLGRPDSPTISASVHEVYPAEPGGGTPCPARCGKAPAAARS